MKLEIAYLGHDNSIDLILKADGVAQPLASFTKMTLTFDTLLVSSTNLDTDPIRWGKLGYGTGEVRLFLGGIPVPPKSYNVPLILFDSSDLEGIVWDFIPIKVVAEVEAGT
jgi:hypothetical protein